MNQISSEEYYEIKCALEAMLKSHNQLVDAQTKELIALRQDVNDLRKEHNLTNKIYAKAVQVIAKRGREV